jgi:hypothetical protein
MGLEASCPCRWTGGSGPVKIHLDATSLTLRGALRRTIPRTDITSLHQNAGNLFIQAAGEETILELGPEAAPRWLKKLLTPPPTLAEKLGLNPTSRALLVGTTEDPALLAALDGHTARTEAEAALTVAIIPDAASLQRALHQHATAPPGRPLWLIHGKGKSASFGETPIRHHMRAAGYIDTKVAAVSATLSATRFVRR